jgi:hypothetical protein
MRNLALCRVCGAHGATVRPSNQFLPVTRPLSFTGERERCSVLVQRRRCVSLAAVCWIVGYKAREENRILKPWGDWSRKDSAQRGRPAVPDHWTGRPGGSGAQPPLHLIYMVKVGPVIRSTTGLVMAVLRVIIPENAHLNLYGNGWDCDRGFARSEARCAIVQIPRNGELDFTGHSWKCLRGYERDGNVCRPFTIPENAVMRLDGNGWICNLRFKRSGNECVAMTEQEIAFQNLLIMRARACGKSYNYDVSGYCGGEYVHGNVDACSQSKEVTGHVTFDNGAEMDFTGEWISKGEIEGTDGFGNSCDLEVD